jgi:hypothetical protein
MISIQDNPRFKKDCEKYTRAIRECKDELAKKELKSLYDQFLGLVKQLDASFGVLISEKISNSTQHQETQNRLTSIRIQLEKKISNYHFNSK